MSRISYKEIKPGIQGHCYTINTKRRMNRISYVRIIHSVGLVLNSASYRDVSASPYGYKTKKCSKGKTKNSQVEMLGKCRYQTTSDYFQD